jgi:hypothetical protein
MPFAGGYEPYYIGPKSYPLYVNLAKFMGEVDSVESVESVEKV